MTILSEHRPAPGRHRPVSKAQLALRFDYVLLLSTLFIAVLGALMVYSATRDNLALNGDDPRYYLKRQALYVVVGALVMGVPRPPRLSLARTRERRHLRGGHPRPAVNVRHREQSTRGHPMDPVARRRPGTTVGVRDPRHDRHDRDLLFATSERAHILRFVEDPRARRPSRSSWWRSNPTSDRRSSCRSC